MQEGFSGSLSVAGRMSQHQGWERGHREGGKKQPGAVPLSSPLQDSGPVPAALLPLLPPFLVNFKISLWKSCGSVDFVVALCDKERSKMLLKIRT